METEKRDFENLDVRLYLALAALRRAVDEEHPEWVSHSAIEPAWAAAGMVMLDFEDSHGPLPDWAIGRNWGYSLVPGAQLCTKDGRRTGNAHVIDLGKGIAAGPVFVPSFLILTDAGSKAELTTKEIEDQFHIGDWISDVQDVLKKFDRNGHFKNL
ncbi:hypothetical protein D3C76_28430 [compost metagenome]